MDDGPGWGMIGCCNGPVFGFGGSMGGGHIMERSNLVGLQPGQFKSQHFRFLQPGYEQPWQCTSMQLGSCQSARLVHKGLEGRSGSGKAWPTISVTMAGGRGSGKAGMPVEICRSSAVWGASFHAAWPENDCNGCSEAREAGEPGTLACKVALPAHGARSKHMSSSLAQ